MTEQEYFLLRFSLAMMAEDQEHKDYLMTLAEAKWREQNGTEPPVETVQ